MEIKVKYILILLLIFAAYFAHAQKRDKASFQPKKNECWDDIKEKSESYRSVEDDEKLVFRMNFDGYKLPKSKDEFKTMWHNPPISQGWTGTCWCFATTSFLESELKRKTGLEIKISEMFTVYYEYIEKARRFVRERGDSHFAEGSLGNTVLMKWEKYGCAPASAYSGMLEGQDYHDHSVMYKEMNDYLQNCKSTNFWNEDVILGNIRSILNHYLGEPPASFTFEGKQYTPMSFYKEVIKLKTSDYVDLMSLMEKPFWEKAEYDVPDNWWNSEEYYNIPVDVFINAAKSLIRQGHTILIGGDVSESGYSSYDEVAMIPSYDIPSEYIDDFARQFRFSNKSTTDDHAIHLVGWREIEGDNWFLVKDSGSGSRNGPNVGYYFYHEDYIKLKIMNLTFPKEAVPDILQKFSSK